ncbi:PREDICTED: DNA-directed primase/polymerase protein-like [Acropora digitifera]|uniref:DNA-directed primase/polymerase protein-like n=1 Tax=Acropora digitifera TaxID=70779 RepID=UPI00077A4613|nr:PREDICTED: DNA-directed primase/polymerase protein-like [Acropora digitifera]
MADSDNKVKSFYGIAPKRYNKRWEEKKIKLEKCARDFRQNPIFSARKLRIDDPVPVYRTFPRQQMAFEYARTCHQDVNVFAKEKDLQGKRIYLVATLPHFWYNYTRNCLPENRNYYEVIPEGAACRLYFDLEFKTEFNPDKDGTKMVDIFIKYVCYQLKNMYGLECGRKFIVDLDSSTASKFSRHLIFHLPGAVFKDNIHVGTFVRHILALLQTKLEYGSEQPDSQLAERGGILCCNDRSPALIHQDNAEKRVDGVRLGELKELFVKDEKGSFVIFCDQGVYTKNRNFRIFKSTKIGKKSHLAFSNQNMFKPSPKGRKGSFSKDTDYLFFLDSLVSNVSMQVDGKDVRILTCESCLNSCKIPPKRTAQGIGSQVPTQTGYEHSSYPDIDRFVLSVVNRGGVQGEIRKWVYFPQGKLLTYDILKNQWCENIGRPHKSNHIMIVVDIKHGVYYQKCHDPDCRRIDYRSPERPIPEDIDPLMSSQSVEDLFISDDVDDELCKAVAEFEEGVYGNVDPRSDGTSTSENQECSNETNVKKTFEEVGKKRCLEIGIFAVDDEESDEELANIMDDDPRVESHSSKMPRVVENGEITLEACEKFLDTRNIVTDEHALNTGFEALTEVDVPQESYLPDNLIKPCYTINVTAEAEGTSTEALLDTQDIVTKEHSDSTGNAIVAVHSGEVNPRERYQEEFEPVAEVDNLTDEDAGVWIDEDSVSDLDLSFAAEEVENNNLCTN